MPDYTPSTEIVQQIIAAYLKKLKLVTREEFDTQTKVLLKTRLKVEQLEKMLMELNAKQPN